MNNSKGFTLVELVVVIAIVGVLAAILVPNMLTYIKKAQLKSANTNAKTAYNAVVAHFVDKTTEGATRAKIVTDLCNCQVDCGAPLGGSENSAQKEVHEVLEINGVDSGNVYIGACNINGVSSYFAQWSNSDTPGSNSEDIVGQYPHPIDWNYYKTNGSDWGNYMN